MITTFDCELFATQNFVFCAFISLALHTASDMEPELDKNILNDYIIQSMILVKCHEEINNL